MLLHVTVHNFFGIVDLQDDTTDLSLVAPGLEWVMHAP